MFSKQTHLPASCMMNSIKPETQPSPCKETFDLASN